MNSSLIMSPLQTFIFYRTYSRWLENEKRRETFEEVFGPVGKGRYLTYMHSKFGDNVPDSVWRLIEQQMIQLGSMPSMRAAWTAGPALEANNIAGYNCACIAFDSLQSAVELFYILMCGTGVGFSVEQKYITKMPSVPKQTGYLVGTHVVKDSKEGWADSLKIGLETWFQGNDIRFDYSEVRPAGARLKTMGGRASGPDPLKRLLDFCRDSLLKAQGRKLSSVEWLDIGNLIGEVVVVGGVRRSSEISFSDLNDTEMRDAKVWPFPQHRSMSNNSVCYSTKPDMVTFMREWASLAASGTGERGIFNLEAAKKAAPRRTKALKEAGLEHLLDDLRTNPCVPGDTEVLTDNGYCRIDCLLNKETNVWNGFEWSLVTPKITGHNRQMLKVAVSSGQELVTTENHTYWLADGYTGKKISVFAKDLKIGDKLIKHDYPVIEHGDPAPKAYTQGFISGDGMDDYPLFQLYSTKYMCLGRLSGTMKGNLDESRVTFYPNFKALPKAFVPFLWNLSGRLDWLAGLMDSDGTELIEGGCQIGSVDRQFLLNIQKMLTTMGTSSKISLMREAGRRVLPDNKGGKKEYECQACYRLMIGAVQVQNLKKMGLRCERLLFDKAPQRDASQFVRVESVEDAGVCDTVYCFTEPKRHLGCFNGIVTGQCGEINLIASTGEFCNLSEVVVRATDTFDDLLEKVKAAVWLGAMQATLTNFPYLRPSWKETCDRERLLGVSLTGQMDNPDLMTPELLTVLKGYAIKQCRKACKALEINMSVAITTGKPSGTVSQLVNCASGAHPRFGRYYIRRVRIDAKDPLFFMMRSQGVPFSPENGQRSIDVDKKREKLIKDGHTPEAAKILVPDWHESQVMMWVVSFPEAAPPNCLTRHEVSALEQLEWYLKLKKNWCEHNQSITVYIRDHEWLSVGDWVYKNWDDVSGISFLPYDGGHYEQAPYEEITEKEYQLLTKAFPPIDYTALSAFEQSDNTSGAKTYACSGDTCELT